MERSGGHMSSMPSRVLRLLGTLILVGMGLAGSWSLPRAMAGAAGAAQPAYAPQPQRNAEWDGLPGGLNAPAIRNIAANDGYMLMNKIDYGNDIQKQFIDVRNISAAAKQHSNNIKILAYYMMSYWTNSFARGLQPYAASFNTSWLIKDANGNMIPFYGVGGSAKAGRSPIGYMIDLTNQDYQTWLVHTA